MADPRTGSTERVRALSERCNVSRVISQAIDDLREIEVGVRTCRAADGKEFEINPASETEVVLLDKDGKVKATLNMALMLRHDEEGAREAQALARSLGCGYGKELMDIMVARGGRLVLSPTEMQGIPGELLGMRPMFVAYSISESRAVRLAVDFLLLRVPKNALAATEALRGGRKVSRQRLTDLVNRMGRMLSPLAAQIRRIMIGDNLVMHNDETVHACTEAQRGSGGTRSKSYIWALRSGRLEGKQGVSYLASDDRAHTNFLRQFGITHDPGGGAKAPPGLSVALESLVTDCFQGYRKGIGVLEALLGRKVRLAACHAHLRRYFVQALDNMGLGRVFDRMCDGPAAGFGKRLDEALAAEGATATPLARKVVLMGMLVECVLRIDHAFASRTEDETREIRDGAGRGLMDQLGEVAMEVLGQTDGIVQVGRRDGSTEYENRSGAPWGKALVYLLNNMAELRAFLDDPRIECTNNPAERSLRSAVCGRKAFHRFESRDGFTAYADLMTIVMTCRINGVNPYEYMQWAIDNAKLRLERFRRDYCRRHDTTVQLCMAPRPSPDTPEKSLYGPASESYWDNIDWEGLDVWSYQELLVEEQHRLKPEYA